MPDIHYDSPDFDGQTFDKQQQFWGVEDWTLENCDWPGGTTDYGDSGAEGAIDLRGRLKNAAILNVTMDTVERAVIIHQNWYENGDTPERSFGGPTGPGVAIDGLTIDGLAVDGVRVDTDPNKNEFILFHGDPKDTWIPEEHNWANNVNLSNITLTNWTVGKPVIALYLMSSDHFYIDEVDAPENFIMFTIRPHHTLADIQITNVNVSSITFVLQEDPDTGVLANPSQILSGSIPDGYDWKFVSGWNGTSYANTWTFDSLEKAKDWFNPRTIPMDRGSSEVASQAPLFYFPLQEDGTPASDLMGQASDLTIPANWSSSDPLRPAATRSWYNGFSDQRDISIDLNPQADFTMMAVARLRDINNYNQDLFRIGNIKVLYLQSNGVNWPHVYDPSNGNAHAFSSDTSFLEKNMLWFFRHDWSSNWVNMRAYDFDTGESAYSKSATYEFQSGTAAASFLNIACYASDIAAWQEMLSVEQMDDIFAAMLLPLNRRGRPLIVGGRGVLGGPML